MDPLLFLGRAYVNRFYWYHTVRICFLGGQFPLQNSTKTQLLHTASGIWAKFYIKSQRFCLVCALYFLRISTHWQENSYPPVIYLHEASEHKLGLSVSILLRQDSEQLRGNFMSGRLNNKLSLNIRHIINYAYVRRPWQLGWKDAKRLD